ncbi:PAS domain S-box-containing protein/diguanylate cyclase (GGDEF) domain-containing protein [Roseateles sp. YR242]|uniref:diguanylate cyclase domain-containing protein n=1 Tax=Roseateles sp. YR242 TaxID=1855305 RepID=UPI0008B436B8|nr:diguanylate cyclase [Roseateles sp. YR242]SEL81550.1 PAS domain S-box-containing protein/diguanylate cyclase (GGDEF) domain-containing protein [Roseateles sp. YR242]
MERLKPHPAAPLRRFAAWLLVANIVVDGALLGAVWQNLVLARASNQRLAEQAAQNLAHSLSLDIDSDLQIVDRVLLAVTRATTEGSNDPLGRARLEAARLEPLLGGNASLHVSFTTARDAPVSDGDDVRPCTLAHRAVATGDGLTVSAPVQCGVSGDWSISMARRLTDGQGRPLGTVIAVLPTLQFRAAFKALDLGAQGAVSLRSDDMRLIARYTPGEPPSPKGVGSNAVSETLRRQLALAPGQGSYRSTTALDGIERINAYRRVSAYPLTVIVGVGAEEVLLTSSAEFRRDLAVAALVMWAMAGLSIHLYRRHRAERQARDATLRVAREQELLLRNELVGMARLQHCQTTWTNEALALMFGYESQELWDTPIRLLYLDDSSYREVCDAGYAAFRAGKLFRTQLQMRRKDGRPVWVDLSGTSVGEDESLWMLADIDALKQSEEEALQLSRLDMLTGLPNRRGLEAWIAEFMPRRSPSDVMAVAYMDLDGFKPINDALGHDAGDEVLRIVGARLSSALREGDLAVRLGGDEFSLTLTSVSGEQEATAVLHRLREVISRPMRLSGGQSIHVDVSVGLAMGRIGDAISQLMHAADEALYAAKRAGKGRVVIGVAEPDKLQ